MNYLEKLLETYPELKSVENDVTMSYKILMTGIRANRTIFTCGNGGSVADSEHIVGELMKGFRLKRELTEKQTRDILDIFAEEAEEIAKNSQQTIPAVSLEANISLSTAFANDVNPDYIFAQQLYGLGRRGDVLIAISTSGNSINVLHAAQIARIKGMKVIGLTGSKGGHLVKYSDTVIKAPSNDVVRIQEYHLPIYHCLCSMLEQKIFSNTKTTYTGSDINFPLKTDLIVFDFDGVFTDNKVYTAQDGIETVICDRRDSLGINMLKKAGIKMFILSTETNPVVSVRAKKMGLEVIDSCHNKKAFLTEYFHKKSIKKQNTIYMGNDLNDLEAMERVGFSVAPNDAHPDIKKIANLVLNEKGGKGAVREFCELLIKNMEA